MLLTDDIPYPRIYLPAEMSHCLARPSTAESHGFLVLRPGGCVWGYWTRVISNSGPQPWPYIRTEQQLTLSKHSLVAHHYPLPPEVLAELNQLER